MSHQGQVIKVKERRRSGLSETDKRCNEKKTTVLSRR